MKTLFTYTLPRPFFGYNIPIAIQSSFIRDYANKNNLIFSLPSTEITKDNCYSIFINLITSKKLNIENIGVVSGYVFPIDNSKFLKLGYQPQTGPEKDSVRLPFGYLINK